MVRLLSMLLVCAVAIGVSADPPMQGQKMSVDQKFLMGAASGGLFEVTISQMALERSKDADVKKVAQKMIDDHGKANQELMKIAQAKGVMVPQQMNPVHMAMVNKLAEERGEDFDECFLGTQVLAHEEALMCFRKEARLGQDSELKEFAKKTLPTLREHARMIRKANRDAADDDSRESAKPGMDHK